MKKFISYLIFNFLICTCMYSQRIATFEIELPKPAHGLDIPVHVNLDAITFAKDSSLALFEINGRNKIAVAFQVGGGENRQLYWLIKPGDRQQKKFRYELTNGTNKISGEVVAENKDGALTFQSNNKNLLRYYFSTVYPPKGIDTNYKRSGFIHPLWTPHGQELTRIQAPDHYHHYGIWNPWTHVLFEKDTVDFWNIKDKKGTVRFANFVSVTNGGIFSEFEAVHEHVVFKKDGSEKIALNELQTVRVYKPEDNADYYLVDFTSQLNCATESPVLLLAYRYAGLGWRTTEFWNNDNCEVLTSEGTTRDNTDGSKAKWCIVQGALPGNDSGGMALLSHPSNYNHPEPMRIWVKNTNGRGDMFFNFAPTKDKDWLLEPGKTYVLRYRFIVFNGKLDTQKAESAWQYFAEPPEVKVGK
jgi:hypothetical protein